MMDKMGTKILNVVVALEGIVSARDIHLVRGVNQSDDEVPQFIDVVVLRSPLIGVTEEEWGRAQVKINEVTDALDAAGLVYEVHKGTIHLMND
jgi:hypothetical protein